MLVHRRAILDTKILDQWIDQGQFFIRYLVIWDDGIQDTWEGRMPILSKRHVKQERLKEEATG